VRTKINANFSELYALVTGGGSTFDPKTIPALTLWLDAADTATLFDSTVGGSNVTTQDALVTRWKDKSGNNFDMIQSVENSKPILKTAFINGKNCIKTDGINDFMSSGANFNGYASFTCFMVSRSFNNASLSFGALLNGKGATLSSNFDGFGSFFGNFANTRSGTGVFSSLALLTSGIFKNLNVTAIQNGQKGNTATLGIYNSFIQINPTEIGLWSRQNDSNPTVIGFAAADYCEILVYGTELTSIQRQQIELYLNQKWAIF
jgi:hypothetical protein